MLLDALRPAMPRDRAAGALVEGGGTTPAILVGIFRDGYCTPGVITGVLVSWWGGAASHFNLAAASVGRIGSS